MNKIRNYQEIGENNEFLKQNSYRNSMKVSHDSINDPYVNEENKPSLDNFSSRTSRNPEYNNLKTSSTLNSMLQNRSPSGHFINVQEFNPEFAKRIAIPNSEWYMPDGACGLTQNSSVILQGLLETNYRFSEPVTKEMLRKGFSYFLAYQNLQPYEQVVNLVLNSDNNKAQGESLELMQRYIIQNKEFFNHIALGLIPDPTNWQQICDSFNVCIQVYQYDQGGNSNIFSPLRKFDRLPLIIFYKNDPLILMYSKDMMEYDGYNTSTLNIIKNKLIKPKDSLFYNCPKLEPKYDQLVEAVYELAKFASEPFDYNEDKFYFFRGKLVESLITLKDVVSEESQTMFFENIRKIQTLILQKNSIKETEKDSIIEPPREQVISQFNISCCRNLPLTSGLFINVFSQCPYCKTAQQHIDIDNLEWECSMCTQKFNSADVGIFYHCRCVFCRNCFSKLLTPENVNKLCKCGEIFYDYDITYNNLRFNSIG